MGKKKRALPKRASRFQSVAYTLKVCESMGWLAGKTEFRQPYHGGQRTGFGMTKDLFGFIDVLAVEPNGNGCVGLQVTSEACVLRRVKKIIEERTEAAMRFLAAHNIIEVWGFKRVYVGNAVRWDARRKEILVHDGQLMAIDRPDLSVLKERHK